MISFPEEPFPTCTNNSTCASLVKRANRSHDWNAGEEDNNYRGKPAWHREFITLTSEAVNVSGQSDEQTWMR